jgi:IS605 OrfB family transposase
VLVRDVVAAAYRRDKTVRHTWRPDAAVVYDHKLLRFEPKGGYQRASLATLEGRITCDLAIGGHQRRLLARTAKVGQADLLCDRKGRWRFHLVVHLPDPEPGDQSGGVLGVDLGLKNLAADSDGTRYSGATVNGLRRRHARLRARLQRNGSHQARRRLRQQRQRQRRFQADVNHGIAKQLVATARTTHRALAVEDLNGLRDRTRDVSRDQRRLLGNWGFFQLRTFLTYKAEAAGITVYAVDPRHTSQTCPSCGLIDRANRKTQATFQCIACGVAGHADHIAAINIARRGASMAGLSVMEPDIPDAGANPRGSPSPARRP